MKIAINKVVGVFLLGIFLQVTVGPSQAQAASCQQSLASYKIKYQSLPSISQGACGARSPNQVFWFQGQLPGQHFSSCDHKL